MADDEEGTRRLLAAHRAVVDSIIDLHDGRVVNTAGDSVLAEFTSPVEAVRAAIESQEALKTRNESLPPVPGQPSRSGGQSQGRGSGRRGPPGLTLPAPRPKGGWGERS
jgi:class 3 adenylate cyclase